MELVLPVYACPKTSNTDSSFDLGETFSLEQCT